MATLIRYELKKILSNRFGLGACIFVLVMLTMYGTVQVTTQKTFDPAQGAYVHGTQAIELNRVRANDHGLLTPGHVKADLADYNEGLAVIEASGDLGVEALYAQQGREAAEARLRVTGDSYYGNLASFTTYEGADGTVANDYDLSEAARRNLSESLAKGHSDGTPYTSAEKELWESRLAEVEFPLRWGWAAGWSELGTGISLMVLAIIAACIAISTVFAGEYQSGTVAIALPTRYGKSKLVRAKVIASLMFAVAYYTACALVYGGIALAFFGIEGFDLPVQVDTIWSPYGMSVGQYALVSLGIGYLVLLGCVAAALLISSKTRGPMPAAVVPMAVIFLGVIIAVVMPPLDRIVALLPWNLLGGTICETLTSYGVGSFAIDRLVAAPILYALVTIACVPLAMRAFAHHQVG